MRIWVINILLVTAITVGNSQEFPMLNAYVETGLTNKEVNAHEKINHLVNRIGSNTGKSDRQFLRQVFNITHRQILKQYKQYSSFGDLFTSGHYDCLTATALYSLLLSHYGFQHQVIETNFHIFLLVESNDGLLLIESTDPLDGFEFQKDKIDQRIEQYLVDQERIIADQTFTSYSLFDKVSEDQLTGLLYYNQSVSAFNNQNWNEAVYLLDEAKKYYQSPRIAELENLLFSVLASIELEKANSSVSNLPAGALASNP